MAAANTQNRGVSNTAFSFNPDLAAQLLGSGAAIPGAIAPTFAATIALDSLMPYTRYIEINGVSTVSSTVSLTNGVVCLPGALLIVNIKASSSGTVTATFSTGFKATGTVAATASTNFPVLFVANSAGVWVEVARASAAVAN